MELETQIQKLGKTVCISLCTNAPENGMNLSDLLTIAKLPAILGSLAQVRQQVWEKEKL